MNIPETFNPDPAIHHYPGLGTLGQALTDFKKMYLAGTTEKWPLFWREFAAQAWTDLKVFEEHPAKMKQEMKALAKK